MKFSGGLSEMRFPKTGGTSGSLPVAVIPYILTNISQRMFQEELFRVHRDTVDRPEMGCPGIIAHKPKQGERVPFIEHPHRRCKRLIRSNYSNSREVTLTLKLTHVSTQRFVCLVHKHVLLKKDKIH